MGTGLLKIHELAAFIDNVAIDRLPQAVIDKAALVFADTLGCMLGGSVTPIGVTAGRVLASLAGSGFASFAGLGHRGDPVSAAYFNALCADALDFEDTLVAHPSATIVPAALAAAEHAGVSGARLLEGIVAGYEVGVRVARAVMASPRRVQKVAVEYAWLAYGAVAAASKVWQLSEAQIIDALGYAGTSTCLPTWITKWPSPLPWTKNNFGEQARAGVLAALMGQAGFYAPRHMLDSEYGFWCMVGSDRYNPAALTEGLGVDYEILKTTFKPYPCCRWIHTILDAVRDLLAQEVIPPQNVEQITVRTCDEMVRWFTNPEPDNLVDAEFSIPYVVAVMLHGIPPGPVWHQEATLRSPSIRHLARRVKLESWEEANAAFADGRRFLVEVDIVAGRRRWTRREDTPRGSILRPMEPDEHRRKFTAMAEAAGASEQLAERLWESALGVARMGNVQNLSEQLILVRKT